VPLAARVALWSRKCADNRQVVRIGQIAHSEQMEHFRSITSSEAKAAFGEVLGSLAAEGPVEITRNGRPVAFLVAPAADLRPANRHRLVELAKLYSDGAVSWRKVEEDTGASFGELLLELGRQALSLPTATAAKRPAQVALFHEALSRRHTR
jgi:prevent-host-death family protein